MNRILYLHITMKSDLLPWLPAYSKVDGQSSPQEGFVEHRVEKALHESPEVEIFHMPDGPYEDKAWIWEVRIGEDDEDQALEILRKIAQTLGLLFCVTNYCVMGE